MGNRAYQVPQRERLAHLKAAKAEGFNVVEIEVKPDGTIRYFATCDVSIANRSSGSGENEWDDILK